MDRAEIKEIVRNWVFPTEKSSYMGGIEDAPVLAKSHGSTVVDTDGKEYLDFQSGQMGAALGHQHPRIVATIERTLKTLMHASNTMRAAPASPRKARQAAAEAARTVAVSGQRQRCDRGVGRSGAQGDRRARHARPACRAARLDLVSDPLADLFLGPPQACAGGAGNLGDPC